MSQTIVVAGLALRELWFSYRLLATLGILLLASAPAAILPHTATTSLAGAPPSPLAWYAVAVGGALAIVSGLTAGALATGRRRGRLGWLVLRPVPRPRLVMGWFVACAGVLLIGLTVSALLAWVALADSSLARVGPLGFAATMGGVAAFGLAAVSLGLCLGAVLPPAAATIGAVLITAAASGVAFAGWLADAPWPTAILPLLSDLEVTARPIAAALPSAGTTLAAVAVLLLSAAMALQRVDL